MKTQTKKSKWYGTDLNKETSLIEYGLLIRKIGADLYDVVYAVGYNEQCEATQFSTTTYSDKESREVINESWFSKNSFLSFVGMEESEWVECNLVNKLSDMIAYYGSENIFGTSYFSQSLKEVKQNMGIRF